MRKALIALALCAACSPAIAADAISGMSSAPGLCGFQTGMYAGSAEDAITQVESNYSVADAAIVDARAINSRRQVFPWALETRFACGEAIGHWKGGTLDGDSVSDCGCFYERMITAR